MTFLGNSARFLRLLYRRLLAIYFIQGDPNMLWSPDHGILAYLTNDS